MIRRVFLFFVLLLHIGGIQLLGQNDSISYFTDLYILGASHSFQPHWQVSNRYGIFDRAEQSQFAGLFALGYKHDFGKKLWMDSKIEFNFRSDISDSYFQQFFFNLNYGSLQLKIGKEAYTIGQYSEDLSVGSLFLSNNSRPLTRIGAGFYDYTPVPLIEKYLEFKGVLNFSILDDDRSKFNGTDKPYFHEKLFYLRSKFLPVNVHAGLNHNAFFGGTTADGTKIPVDFWATFFAQSSDKIGGGEETNVAGAHFGLYDFGLNWENEKTELQLYYQIPFSDGSGKKFHGEDYVIGLLYNKKGYGLFTSVIFEYFNTFDQSGPGLPDPIVNGQLVVPSEIDDIDQFMLENFDTVTVGFTQSQFNNYLEQNVNYGYKFNGRDDHYNNYLYPAGLAYHEEAIGNSLFTSKSNISHLKGDFDGAYDTYFINNRIIAYHLALKGYITPNLSYRTKLTYSINYGSYAGANRGRYSWGSIEDPAYYNSYYFKDGLKQSYTFFELNYSPFENKAASFTSSIAYDFGEMYDNFGVLFGFHYNGFFSLKKTKKD